MSTSSHYALAVAIALSLVGCGGGSGGSKASTGNSGGGTGGSIPGGATSDNGSDVRIDVEVSPGNFSGDVYAGDPYAISIAGKWIGHGPLTEPVYIQVLDSASTFKTPERPATANTGILYQLPLLDNVTTGIHKGELTVRACKTPTCDKLHAGKQARIPYQVQVFKPTFDIAIDTPEVLTTVTPGAGYAVALRGHWQVQGSGPGQAFLQITDSDGNFALPTVVAASTDTSFNYHLPMRNAMENNVRRGVLTVTACKDAACQSPYSGASRSITYLITPSAVADWLTLQGSERHQGYVPLTLNPSRFKYAWTFHRGNFAASPEDVTDVVTNSGTVYFTEEGTTFTYAVNEVDGSQRWRYWNKDVYTRWQSAPTWQNGKLLFTTQQYLVEKPAAHLVAVNPADGTLMYRTEVLPSQATVPDPASAPVPALGHAHIFAWSGGYQAQSYASDGGQPAWQLAFEAAGPSQSPAFADGTLYYSSQLGLRAVNASNGAVVFDIADPYAARPTSFQRFFYSAVILGNRDQVIVQSPQERGLALSSFDIKSRSWNWSTVQRYATQPAIAGGTIFAGRNDPIAVDAIDEATGRILRSWQPGSTAKGFNLIENVVATDNVIFVSTDAAVYALDSSTLTEIWSAPVSGRLAISSGRTLYVVSTSTERPGNVYAFRLD